jgi:uncharacterized protein YodC (DUF2158 family)
LAQKYNTGDVVQLKSGGPKMTVEEYSPGGIENMLHVWCSWFAGSKHERAIFPEDTLEPAKFEKKP